MTKKKIFFDATPLIDTHVSGVGKVLQETLKTLDTQEYSNRYDMSIFVPLDERKKAQSLNYTFIKVKTLPYPHKFLSLFSRLRFGPPIDLFLGKGVYVFENFRNWNLLSSRSITYIHDVSFKVFPEFVQEQNLNYLKKYVGIWTRRADTIVTVSEAARAEIKEKLGIDAVVVPNAVDTGLFNPRKPEEVIAVRKKWNLPQDYFLYIGNIEPRKNIAGMLDGFEQYVKKTGSKSSLVIIGGGGWKNEEIIAKIEQLRRQGIDIIRPDGYVPDGDIPAVTTGARALLQTSWHEGFGLAVLQALACGVPVVASDIPSLREAAQGNHDRIVYVDPANAKSIAEAIEASLSIPRITTPHSIATWSESVEKLIEVIEKN